jgi:DNA polymerase-1
MPEDENPFTQLGYIYAALDAMGIRHTEAQGCECDDIVAAYTLTRDGDTEVVISSYDSDYFQLISDKVTVLRYRGDSSTVCDSRYIEAKFATRPETYADCKALFGDSADNIKGLFGIGPKTAAKIISTHGPLEKILEDTSVILEEKHRKLIEDNRDTLRKNLDLIRLDAHAPLPFSLGELEYSASSWGTMDILRRIGVL